MIDEDIRFFKQHFPKVTIQQPSFKKTVTIGEEYPAVDVSGLPAYGSQVDHRLQYNNISSRMGTQLSSMMTGMRFGGFADLRGGLQKLKGKEDDILEELKQEHEHIRKISAAQSQKTSRVSDGESSVQDSHTSSVRQDSKYLPRESAASVTLHRRLESELGSKMKRIEELLLSERGLQQTVHQLKAELERRQDEIPSKAKQIEAEINHKFQKEIHSYKQETEKFITENTQLKKELVTKSFEIQELRRTADHADQQLRYREEDFRKSIKTMEETMLSKQSHYKRIISQIDHDVHERPFTEVQRPLRDYFNFKRDQLARLESVSTSRWGRHEYADDNSQEGMFRRLLDEQATRFKEKLNQIDKSLKLKVSEIERLERTISHHRIREEELEKQLDHKDASVKRLVESELQIKLNQREELFNRKLIEKEQTWSRRLIEKEEQWNKRNNEALEHEKKTNFEQFQKTLNEIMAMNRHKEAKVQTHTNNEVEYQQTIRRLNNELEQYAAKQREDVQIRNELRNYKAKNELLQKQLDQFKYYMDEQQYNVKAYENEKVKAQMSLLDSENKQLQNTINENAKYISELEAALKPLQPKRPNIMQQSEAQNWKVRQDDYISKLQNLELQYDQINDELQRYKNNDKAAIQSYEEKINNLQAEWGRKQYEMEQTIQTLRSRLEDTSRNKSNQDRNYQIEIDSLKKFIIEAVENPTLQLKHKENEFSREIEKLTQLNSRNEESIRLRFKEEIDNLINIQRRMEAERSSLENQVIESRSQQQALTEVVGRLERQLARKEDIRREEKVTLDGQIARLTSDNQTWKRKYEFQMNKLTRASEEMSKNLNDKYERDITGLKIINQRLMQESADMLLLQNQNQQLVIANRHLQAEVKEKSQAVDHLWSVKMAEYENISLQIRRVKAIQPF